MFHVFALAYLTTGSTVLRATGARVYHDASVHTVSLRMRSVSTMVFKFLKIIYGYAKQNGMWNMFFLVI